MNLLWRVGEWLISGLVGVLLAVFFQPTVEDLRKTVTRWIWPNPTTFEASPISGCSGGELKDLMPQAIAEGLRFLSEARTQNTLLCQRWQRQSDARGILEHMASKFDSCFSVRRDGSYRLFDVLVDNPSICKTDLVLDPARNEWVQREGAELFLCVGPTQHRGRAGGRDCSREELIALGFVRKR
jgi:hypothetical protein